MFAHAHGPLDCDPGCLGSSPGSATDLLRDAGQNTSPLCICASTCHPLPTVFIYAANSLGQGLSLLPCISTSHSTMRP